MEWIAENWELIAAVAGVIVAVLNMLGKAKYAKVVADLVGAIEKANAADVKALAQSASVKSKTDVLLAKVVKQLTGG